MKILIGLSIIQTILLAVIGLRIISMDARINTVSDTSLDVLSTTTQLKNAGQLNNTGMAGSPATTTATLSAADVRWIIKEELAAFGDQQPTATGQTTTQDNSTRQRAIENGENLYTLKADVQQDLDFYIGRGDITQNEMAQLQIKIAKLPPSERGEMLSRLTKSLSSGQIDGRF